MSWVLLFGIVTVLALVLYARRVELLRMRRAVEVRARSTEHGSDALLQHPVIDLSRCLGCGTCVAVCPEDGVLELVHGQAMVVRGARCQGVSACERECPAGAVTVTLANLEERRDIPNVTEELEAVGAPGILLAGEVTAHALIKTAVDHGTAVADAVARRVEGRAGDGRGRLDLCIVGAGPAGIACALEAKRRGLSFVVLEQAGGPGGTVAKYPRRKLVLTRPLDLPLHGRVAGTSFEKEELVALWDTLVREHELPVRGGETFEGCAPGPDGSWVVRTGNGEWDADHVCLALGRRGTPRKLGVPGEELAKVAYGLVDARSYRDRRILVVGGGDSAVEAALGLAEQPDTDVTLAYRREAFFRLRARNEERLEAAVAAGELRVLLRSQVQAIHADTVDLTVADTGGSRSVSLPNDDVFVLAGGTPPTELLERSGVSLDPALRDAPDAVVEQGTGLLRALAVALGLALAVLTWALLHADYYLLPAEARPAHVKHDVLRPGRGLGLLLGLGATALIGLNLLYLVRRSPRFRLGFGSLRMWMASHVATGILALLLAALHAAMAAGDSVGGHALLALAVLLVTGAIGRYFYAWVPRAANGRELELEEVRGRLGSMSAEWDAGEQRFRERARAAVTELVERRQWRSSFPARVLALVGGERDLRRTLLELEGLGRAEDVAPDQIEETLNLARRAHRTALMAAHYEDLRAVLASWRWLHRWVAALLVLLVLLHVAFALAYGAFFEGVQG